ncbi:MAG: hypothetical protein GXZ07_10255 [Firmicutes bacterium]|nr:hypothetical protein [Bacillota bacterium]
MSWRAVVVVLAGFVCLFSFLYWGLNTAEKGINELLALDGASLQAFSLSLEKDVVSILFAGRCYFFDRGRFLDFFSYLTDIIMNGFYR